MPGEYDKETLAQLHLTELEILREVLRICDENSIEYFIIAGTLIGAVRHKGFIPWDDDIDIGLTCANYDKLLSLLPSKLGNNYYYINGEISKKFLLINTRIMKKGTTFHEETFKNIKRIFYWEYLLIFFPLITYRTSLLQEKFKLLRYRSYVSSSSLNIYRYPI